MFLRALSRIALARIALARVVRSRVDRLGPLARQSAALAAGPVALAGLTVAALPVPALAQQQPRWGHGHMWDQWWGGWVFGLFVVVLIAALAVAATLLWLRWRGGTPKPEETPPQARETPLDVLKMRYARGEIDREEFERRKSDLEA